MLYTVLIGQEETDPLGYQGASGGCRGDGMACVTLPRGMIKKEIGTSNTAPCQLSSLIFYYLGSFFLPILVLGR